MSFLKRGQLFIPAGAAGFFRLPSTNRGADMARKTNKKVLEFLNLVYTSEIGAVGIYMDQHAKADDGGYGKLAERLKQDAVEEMKHAEMLMERILFLGGEMKYDKHAVPDMKQTEIVDMFKTNIALEHEAIERLNRGVRLCYEEGDNGSRILLEKILVDEEKHLDEYETTLANIKKYGDAYIVHHLM